MGDKYSNKLLAANAKALDLVIGYLNKEEAADKKVLIQRLIGKRNI